MLNVSISIYKDAAETPVSAFNLAHKRSRGRSHHKDPAARSILNIYCICSKSIIYWVIGPTMWIGWVSARLYEV